MKNIRINNDIDIRIFVKRDESPEDLQEKNVFVWLIVGYKKILISVFNIDGNIISFRYSASEQSDLGIYSIVIQVKDDNGNINTADKCNVFQLVNSSCNIGGTDEPDIQTVSLNYSIDMKLDVGGEGSGGGFATDYNDLKNKPSINNVELIGDKNLKELGIQPAGEYASKNDIPTKNSQLENDSSYATQSQLDETMELIPSKTSELYNDSGFLTQHQDLSSYATKDYVREQIEGSLDVVSLKLDEINGGIV